MYPVFNRIFLERSQVTIRLLRHWAGSEMSAAVHNTHYRDHLAKRIRLPVYSCIFLPLCPFQGSSKHNEVLDSKCQTCNLLLVSSFVVRVCLPSAVFFFFFLWESKLRCFVVCIRDSAGLQTVRPQGLPALPRGPQGNYGSVGPARQAFWQHGSLWCSTGGWNSAEAAALQVVRAALI